VGIHKANWRESRNYGSSLRRHLESCTWAHRSPDYDHCESNADAQIELVRFIESHGIGFDWQEGYGAFSVSQSQLATVKRYIANQKTHHKKRSFEEEFIALLKTHDGDYDPRYVFG
jgi:hypothetical protein